MSLSKSKSTTKPTAFNKPYLEAAGATLAPTYADQQAQAKSFEPGFAQARGLLTDTINGKYLDSNPYTEAYINHAEDDVTDRVNSQFGSRFGSGYHAAALARELANVRNGVQFNQYNTERGHQTDAVGMFGPLAGQATAVPGIASGQYAQNTGGLFAPYNKTTTSTPWGPAFAKAAAQAAAAASDRRLKVDIAKLGEEPDGLGIYEYRYVTDQPDAPLRQGVMADEVATLRPWALGPERGGFATVVYEAL